MTCHNQDLGLPNVFMLTVETLEKQNKTLMCSLNYFEGCALKQ